MNNARRTGTNSRLITIKSNYKNNNSANNSNSVIDYNKLHVLCPYNAAKYEMVKLFTKYGRIEDFKMNKTSLNIALIRYFKASDAFKAFEELNDTYMTGHTEKISITFSNGFKGVREPYKIRITIDRNIFTNDLRNIFNKYGTITECYIPMDFASNSNKTKSTGFISFKKASEAAMALEDCGLTYDAKFEFGSTQIVRKNLSGLNLTNKENEIGSNKQKIVDQPSVSHTATIFKNITNVKTITNTSMKRNLNDLSSNEMPLKKRKIMNNNTENLEPDLSNSHLIAYSRVDSDVLKSIFDLIPGLKEFNKLKENEYSVVYDNELSANYALEKLNKFKTSSSRYDTITLEKKIDIRQELIKKLDENNSKSSLSYVEYFLSQLKKQPTSISNVTQLISKENKSGQNDSNNSKMEEAFKINTKKTSKRRNDTSVQGTNDSSILSKISTCQSGYFQDDFLKYFATKIVKRSSLVNRGYYIRAKLLDFIVKEFIQKTLTKSNQNQIINLGAGFDATYFRLKTQNLLEKTLFIEIDFPDVISRKVNLIKSNENLHSLCPGLDKLKEVNENIVYGCEMSNYILIGIDMRNTGLLEVFLKTIKNFSETENTLLISEVVLTYMAVNSCNGVIKWIGETFQNSVLAAYEQINPYDGFGQVMLDHFKKLGSPLKCIMKYPTLNSQIERYRNYGFTDCFATRASDFYSYHTPNEEKKRIEKLELFDEYEPWHQKCSHYLIISATKGNYLTDIMSNLYNQIKIPHSIKNDSLETNEFESIIKLKQFEKKFGTRFGHTVCYSSRRLFIFGGFGEMITDLTGKHMRHCSLEVFNLDTKSIKVLNQIIDPNNLIGDRIFHTNVVWEENEQFITILIIFGRSNPSKIFNSIVKVKYSLELDDIESIETLYSNNDYARFRHAACLTHDSKLFIFGGKSTQENASFILNDVLLFDRDFNIKQIELDESLARHSHSICKWKHYIIISGGLDKYENPLNDIILFDCNTHETRSITLKSGEILPRYSHTSHVVDDYLILIGGVNYLDIPPGVCFLDLNRLDAYEFNIQFQTINLEPFMLNNHQSYLIDKETLLVIGGGGICFTFGTHLNRHPIMLDLGNCWSKLENKFI